MNFYKHYNELLIPKRQGNLLTNYRRFKKDSIIRSRFIGYLDCAVAVPLVSNKLVSPVKHVKSSKGSEITKKAFLSCYTDKFAFPLLLHEVPMSVPHEGI
jgi:hypothetical protein